MKIDFMWVSGLNIKTAEKFSSVLFCRAGTGRWVDLPAWQHNKGLHALLTAEELSTFQERPCVLVEIFSSNHIFALS